MAAGLVVRCTGSILKNSTAQAVNSPRGGAYTEKQDVSLRAIGDPSAHLLGVPKLMLVYRGAASACPLFGTQYENQGPVSLNWRWEGECSRV